MLKARALVFAESANVTAEGKVNILGTFTALRPQQVPFVFPRFVIVVLLQGEDHDFGTHRSGKFFLYNPRGTKVFEGNGPIDLIERTKDQYLLPDYNFILSVENLEFTLYGTHTFKFVIDDGTTFEMPLGVLKSETPST